MLQDMRHLVILDLRESEAFDESHIRFSINCSTENFQDQAMGAMLATRDTRFRSHYANDDLTRVLYIFPADRAKEL